MAFGVTFRSESLIVEKMIDQAIYIYYWNADVITLKFKIVSFIKVSLTLLISQHYQFISWNVTQNNSDINVLLKNAERKLID